MQCLDVADYPPAIAELLRDMKPAPLGPGTPERSVKPKLEALGDAAFGGRVADRDMAAACRAGLWLAFNFLDESHTLSQGIETAEGSAWHAIMHRREPDAGNSKYWWRRVGSHPFLDRLREQAPAIGYRYSNPFAFVDFVERVRDGGTPDEELAKRVLQLEWQLLFDHCFRRSVAG